MGFIIVLMLSALSIAGSAAFFSIYGLAQIFSGSFWPVVIMASSLEAGKLVAASYVYRYWQSISFVMKTYLITAIIILMLITSTGIFGFLSSAYQQDMLPIKQGQQEIVMLTAENVQLNELKVERTDRKRQIDADIAALPNNFITGRQRLLKSFGPELDQLKEDVSSYTIQIRENTTRIHELKTLTLDQETHAGPIIFIAQVFERGVDDTTKYLILLIIFAFDPLAVALTVATNHAIALRAGNTAPQPTPPTPPPVAKREEEIEEPEVEEVDDEPEEEEEIVSPVVIETIDEPEPKITTVEQLVASPVEGLTLEQLKSELEKFQVPEHELTDEERVHKELLQLQLARNGVKDKIRKG